MSTPSFLAYSASSACSASMNAASPPAFCASAMTCSESVVLPDDSGPKISTMRPRGTPPTPRAASTPIEPVEIALIGGELLRPQAHDRAFAELALDLRERGLGRFQFVSRVLWPLCLLLQSVVGTGRRGERMQVDSTGIRVVKRVYDDAFSASQESRRCFMDNALYCAKTLRNVRVPRLFSMVSCGAPVHETAWKVAGTSLLLRACARSSIRRCGCASSG